MLQLLCLAIPYVNVGNVYNLSSYCILVRQRLATKMCLGGIVLVFRVHSRKILADVPSCRSVDCLLVKLSIAIYALEDLLRGNPFIKMTSTELVKEFLYNEEVQPVLASLAGYENTVVEKVQNTRDSATFVHTSLY